MDVEQEGFNKVVTQENRLEINQSLRFDVTLTVGAVSQTVTVESQTSRVETVNPTVGATVTGDAIQQAPLNGRNVLSLALLQPGVTESNPDNTGAGGYGNGWGYSIAGGRTDSVTFLLDGSLNNDLLDNGVVFNPNPDTIAGVSRTGEQLHRGIRPQRRRHHQRGDQIRHQRSGTAAHSISCATATWMRIRFSTT